MHSFLSLWLQVCRQLHDRISSDKQLWVIVLEQHIHSKGFHLHPRRIGVETASAAQVESWVRCFFRLQRSFKHGLPSSISRVKLDLHVTWMKVIRTRWCLVASSNITPSRLTVWKLDDGGPPVFKDFYISGPVIGGIVEDNNTMITAALTIGDK